MTFYCGKFSDIQLCADTCQLLVAIITITRKSLVMGHVDHGSRGSWVTLVMGHVGNGSHGSRVSSLMGQTGHGSQNMSSGREAAHWPVIRAACSVLQVINLRQIQAVFEAFRDISGYVTTAIISQTTLVEGFNDLNCFMCPATKVRGIMRRCCTSVRLYVPCQ